ncbi:MAG: hypothetical protein LUC48_08155 [Clostridiales bacterium]|nr:hypothetical protein [Clostridiales bacterium]
MRQTTDSIFDDCYKYINNAASPALFWVKHIVVIRHVAYSGNQPEIFSRASIYEIKFLEKMRDTPSLRETQTHLPTSITEKTIATC